MSDFPIADTPTGLIVKFGQKLGEVVLKGLHDSRPDVMRAVKLYMATKEMYDLRIE